MKQIPALPDPLNVCKWIHDCLLDQNSEHDLFKYLREFLSLEKLSNVCKRMTLIKSVFNVICGHSAKSGQETLVHLLDTLKVTGKDLDTLPIAIALPIREALYQCRTTISDDLNANQLMLIGRADLAEQLSGVKATPSYQASCKFADANQHPADISAIYQAVLDKRNIEIRLLDNVSDHESVVKLKFHKNKPILEESASVFLHEEPQELDFTLTPNISEDEISNEQQQVLQRLANQVWGTFVGRGAYLLESQNILPTEPVPIPDISISARLPPISGLIKLNIPANSHLNSEWPEFHAGVSSGLQVRSNAAYIDSSWVIFNQKYSAENGIMVDPKHGGFTMGLGLRGHLTKMDKTDALKFIFAPKQEMVVMGYLLGLSVSHVGTRDHATTRALSVFIPSLLPPNSADLNIPPICNAAAVVGYGIVHLGSCVRSQMEKMLHEISRLTLSTSDVENAQSECYANACGFALGFICLDFESKTGGDKSGISSRKLGLVDKLMKLTTGMNSILTGSASFIALGLAFLKTNEASIASKIQMPTSLYMLDFIRPDQLMLLVIARNLILWESIEPNVKWVQLQLPKFVRDHVAQHGKPENDPALDNEGSSTGIIWFAYCQIIVGASICIALKYAGSMDESVCTFLVSLLDDLSDMSNLHATTFETKILKTTTRSSVFNICVAISVVMAGSGDEQCFNRFKALRSKITPDMTFGHHMAISMAIGFLFLGQGLLTFGTSNKAIAGLFCSLFPVYPATPSDNRAHLQAFRYLWVLAIENRCLITRDVDTRQPTVVPVVISVSDRESLEKTKQINCFSPCILPNVRLIKEISISGPRYWTTTYKLDAMSLVQRSRILKNLWVKRKTGHLPYTEVDSTRIFIITSVVLSTKLYL